MGRRNFTGAAGASAGAFTPSYFSAHVSASVTYTAVVWEGVAVVATLIDDTAQGISRAGSRLTFADAGVYAVTMHAVVNGSNLSSYAFRLRDVLNAKTLARGFGVNAPSWGLASIDAQFTITSPGDTADLEYALLAGTAAAVGAAATPDADPTSLLGIQIQRIG